MTSKSLANPATKSWRHFALETRSAVIALLAWLFWVAPWLASAQEHTFITLSGAPDRPGAVDGSNFLARFNNPLAVAVDAAGNVYVADRANHTIRKVAVDGTTATLAGLAGSPGSADGTGATARFRRPSALAVDAAGNVYVADTGNHLIRKITPAAKVVTLAGLAGTPGINDGVGAAARFNLPRGITVNSAGVVYVSDTANHALRRISTNGTVITLAGLAGQSGDSDGTRQAARFNFPQGVTVDLLGTIYIADTTNSTIRRVTPAGVVTTLVGRPGSTGVSDGWGDDARFNSPVGIAVAGTNLCVSDTLNNTLRLVYTNGLAITLASQPGPSGQADGPAFAASFNRPHGLAADAMGNLYVADTSNHALRKLTPADTNGFVTTLAGPVGSTGSGDGYGTAAQFNAPAGVAASGTAFYIADSRNHLIRRVSQNGRVNTVAGQAGIIGTLDGPSTNAAFNNPRGVAVLPDGSIVVADSGNHWLRLISPAGIVTNLAGQAGRSGSDDGAPGDAQFNLPEDVATDPAGRIYVADTRNHTIRIVFANAVATLAGTAGEIGTVNGTGAAARFNNPAGLAVDVRGALYVADSYNHVIRKLTPVTSGTSVQWNVTTFAGRMGVPGGADGPRRQATFYFPSRVVVDAADNVYVADTGNHTIRRIAPDGTVTTFAGRPAQPGNKDGSGLDARFFNPTGIGVDTEGRIGVSDTQNETIRRITPAGDVTTLAGPAGVPNTADGTWFSSPGGIAVDAARNIYVPDYTNCTIRQVFANGAMGTLAGLTGIRGRTDGSGDQARFDHPFAVATDPLRNIYIADTVNFSIRLLTIGTNVQVQTLVGKPGTPGSSDGYGGSARFNFPCGLAAAGVMNLFVADFGNHTIRWMTPDLKVTTVAGRAGQSGSADGTGRDARFNFPRGVAVDGMGNVFVADTGNHTIRKIAPGGIVTTYAGLAGSPGAADGSGAAARFNFPQSLAVDAVGNLFVADSGNHTVRRITPGGLVITVAGQAGAPGNLDGTGQAVRFNGPAGIAARGNGRVWVSDARNNSIRRGVPAAPDRPVVDMSFAPVGQERQLDIADFSASTWSWSVVRRPAGSVAELSPSSTARNPTFTPDVADLFVFQLAATNAAGEIALRTVAMQGATPMLGGVIIRMELRQTQPVDVFDGSPQSLAVRSVSADHQIAVTLQTVPAQPCAVWVSTNLADWTVLTTFTNVTGSAVLFDSVTNAPYRFYKLQPLY